MIYDGISAWALSSILLSLRIAPVVAFAPPFTLVRMPRLFHVLFGVGLAALMVTANPQAMWAADGGIGNILYAAVGELALGAMFVLAFQLPFSALYFAGRLLDLQAGFGLALLVDATSRAQSPLVGTLFAYAAGAIFFSMNGHIDLLRLFTASLDAIPIGGWTLPAPELHLFSYISLVFLLALAAAGAAILGLYLIDIAIALLARTVPQMNVLILGFQVKTIALLLILPLSFGFGGALFVRLLSHMLAAVPELI